MQIPFPVIPAALVSGAFSVLTLIVVLINEKRKRREEARLRHLQRQIEELYGPLYGLIQFGAAGNSIRMAAGAGPIPEDENGWPKSEEDGHVLRFFREQYYLPLNRQMVELNPELYCEIAASQIARRNDYDMY